MSPRSIPPPKTPPRPENPVAFPDLAHDGMTLRDYFAAHALHGFLSGYTGSQVFPSTGLAAEWAYAYADAMLAERVK